MKNEIKEINFEESDSFLVNESSKSKTNIIELILSDYGYGRNTWKMFFIVFFHLLTESIHVTYFGNLIIPVKNYYNLNDSEISFHSSTIFIALALGSFSIGYTSKCFKRSNIIIFGQMMIVIMHLLIGLVGNIVFFSIMRFIIGFILGMTTPIILNIMTEYLPISNRGLFMIFMPGFKIGQLVMPLLMLWLMPNMETANYPNLVLVSSGFSFLSFILSLLLLRDSPRNLILTNNIDEGISILEELNRKPLKKEEKELIIHQVVSGINNNIKSSFKDLFNDEYYKSTILLSLIHFINLLICFGTFLVYSLTIKELDAVEMTNNEIKKKQIYVNLINLSSNFFGGLLCDNSYLGRIKGLILCSVLGIISIIFGIIYSDYFVIIFGIFINIIGVIPNITSTYVSELYPTKIRDLALGYIFSCGRIGAFLSQVIFVYLNNAGIWVPYYVSIGLIVTNIILLILLPIETYKRSLDLGIKEEIK